jgi:predicted RNase H-like HicB family nuclease
MREKRYASGTLRDRSYNRVESMENDSMKLFKIIVEKHHDGYVAYPLGIKGAVVGEGDTYEEALADVNSAIRCYIEIFGTEMLEDESPVIEAFLTEAEVAI